MSFKLVKFFTFINKYAAADIHSCSMVVLFYS